MARALREQGKVYRRAKARCEDGPTEKRVHAFRVESRRIGAQLDLFASFIPRRSLRRAHRVLKRLLDCLADLRDSQVLMQLVQAGPLSPAPRRWSLHALQSREHRWRKRAGKKMGKVKFGRLRDVLSALSDRLESSEGSPSRQLRDRRAILRAVDAAQRRLVECRQAMDAGHVMTLHAARVRFKTLRYMMEALQPIFPERMRGRMAAMQQLQSLFGQLQDIDVFLQWLDKHLKKHPERAEPLALLRHWLLRRRAVQIRHCMDRADDLVGFWPIPELRRNTARRL